MKKTRIAVVGGGRMGFMRWEQIVSLSGDIATPICIVEGSAELANVLASRGVPVRATLEDALPDIDAVIICTPTLSHKQLILASAAAGKHIYCEKPLAYTEPDIIECHAAATRNNVMLWVAWQKRYDPKFAALRASLGDEPWLHINMVNRDHPMPSVSLLCSMGDLWSDCAVHEFNLALWFSNGEIPVAVQSFGNRSFNAGALDRTMTLLSYADGRTVLIENSRHSPEHKGYDQRVEVVTNTRSLRAEDSAGERYHSFGDRYADAFREGLRDFVRACGGDASVVCRTSEADDVATARMAASALRSHYTSRTVPEKTGAIGLRFVGMGKFGSAIRDILAPQDKSFCLLEPVRRRTGGVSLESALAQSSTEAVYICSPDAHHGEHAKLALYAGKHVLVEKPVGGYDDVRMQAMSNGLVLMVGFQRRFASQFIAAKASGIPTKSIHIRSADPVPSVASRDTLPHLLSNSVIHDIDLLCWILPPRTVFTNLHLEARPHGGLHISLLACSGTLNISVTIDFKKDHPTYLQSVMIDSSKWFGYDHVPTGRPDGQVWVDLYKDAYAAQFAHFGKLIRGQEYDPYLTESYAVTFSLLDRFLALVPTVSKL